MSQPGNFPHSSDKMGREVPEHSDAVSFDKGIGNHNFLSDDTTIIPTTDIQVGSFVLTIWGLRDLNLFNFTLPRDFVLSTLLLGIPRDFFPMYVLGIPL